MEIALKLNAHRSRENYTYIIFKIDRFQYETTKTFFFNELFFVNILLFFIVAFFISA